MALKLKPYQLDGANWVHSHPRSLLADEAGLGKSVQLLLAAEEPVLVVAPAMVLESGTWDDEVARWTPDLDVTQVAYSSLAQRGPKGRVDRDTNGFPLCPPKDEYLRHWGTVILDEAHYVKGRKTNWSVACEKLKADRIEMATGTPLQNWASEAYMLLRMLHPAEARAGKDFGSYWRWVKEWFVVEKDFFGALQVSDLRPDRTWEEFREANWRGLLLQRLREEVLSDLPPLTRQQWRTPMTAPQLKAYKELRKDYVTWLDSRLEVSVWSEPGALVKLAMIATGLENVDPTLKPGTTGKFKHLATILQDRPRQTLVVGHFRNTVDNSARVAEVVGKSAMVVHGGIKSAARKEAIRAFQRGEIDVLCASVNTISEGMTLHQGGCDQTVRMERSWTPSKNEQVDRRLHRIGVERPVHIIDMVTPDSLDERVIDVLDRKTDQQMKALRGSELKPIV